MDRKAEIEKINHELDILRARHALYAKYGRIWKVFVMPLFAVALAAVAVMIFFFDTAYGVFFVAITFALTGYIIWYSRGPYGYAGRRYGWIDLASSPIRFTNRYTDLGSFLFRWGPSDAQMIEEQIAEREQRLLELGAAS
jgi:hypothetical protein